MTGRTPIGEPSKVSRETVARATKSAGEFLAGTKKRLETFRSQLAEIYLERTSNDPEKRSGVRGKAFALVLNYASQRPFTDFPTPLREQMLVEMGAAVERCLMAVDEHEFHMTIVREWNW
jgi:hypothetical protein